MSSNFYTVKSCLEPETTSVEKGRNSFAAKWSFLTILAAVLIIYLGFPTKVYYWDGVSFAQHIEQADLRPVALLHPNHLLYSPLGHRIWSLANSFGLNVRALTVLQVLNSIMAAAAVAVMFSVLVSVVNSGYVAACLSLAFAFSATWWKFATDANSYIPSVAVLLVCLRLLVPERRVSPVTLGLVHAASMLFHELAVLFFPAAVAGLYLQETRRVRPKRLAAVVQYTLTAAGCTLVVYYLAFVASHGNFDFPAFLRWISSHSAGASFSFSIWNNTLVSLAGHVKLLLGGQLRLVREQWDGRMALTIIATIAVLGIFLLEMYRRPLWPFSTKCETKAVLSISLTTIASYELFLFLWLPHNTFYRLFYLPAIVLVVGIFLRGLQRTGQLRLAFGVAAIFLLNFSFHIYPQTRPAANRTLGIAAEMQTIWPQNTIVYWDVYSSDNQTIRYFNPQVEWKELWGRAWISQIEESVSKASRNGGQLWFDGPAMTKFRSEDAEFRRWLDQNCRLVQEKDFSRLGKKVGFVQLVCSV